MISVRNLTKTYGPTRAVDELTFDVRPGIVTGFLGPNGSGKSTTMRMILGLDRPTAGTATVNGRALADHAAPITQIGAMLEARAIHPKRSARNHLRALAATTGIGRRRVDEVLDLVGLTDVADRTAGGFSLGMGQRLGIASALLGDPGIVMLDEPVNGLDPEGILWIRGLLKDLAAQGRTVFVSSHLMSEMALTAEHFVIVGRGRLIADLSIGELSALDVGRGVFVRTPDAERLERAVRDRGATVTAVEEPGGGITGHALEVRGLDSEAIGRLCAAAGIVLVELTPIGESLESVFMDLTKDAVQYRSNAVGEPSTAPTREAA